VAAPGDTDSDDEFDFESFVPDDDVFEGARQGLNDEFSEARRTTENPERRKRIAIIRTSDRISYRRCRRKWNWSHSSRGNLQMRSGHGPFWLGTGMHFAFEDFHGHRRWDHPRDALTAYYSATKNSGADLPFDVEDLYHLGLNMLDYYEVWLEGREELKTYVVNGEPQVEVNFFIDIPKEHLLKAGCPQEVLDLYDVIYYSVTIDRVIIDAYGRLWTVEYKSAKQYAWMHLDTDPQVTAYHWAAQHKYPEMEIAGTIYQQHKKQILKPPKFVASTGTYSTSKSQKTSYALYLGALRNLFGNDHNKYPDANRRFLEYIQTQETQQSDSLIRRDEVERNSDQSKSEYQKILWEVSEMINPNTPLYPNPTRDCSWDCKAFVGACIGMDAGEDWSNILRDETMSRTAPETYWRRHLRYPEQNEKQRFY